MLMIAALPPLQQGCWGRDLSLWVKIGLKVLRSQKENSESKHVPPFATAWPAEGFHCSDPGFGRWGTI